MSPAHVVTEAYAVTTAISAHVWTPKSDYLQIIMQMVCPKDKDEEVSSFITCLATNIKSAICQNFSLKHSKVNSNYQHNVKK